VAKDVESEGQAASVSQFQALKKIHFKPDYTLDTPQVYKNFAIAALQSPLAFDLLHCAGAFGNITTRLQYVGHAGCQTGGVRDYTAR